MERPYVSSTSVDPSPALRALNSAFFSARPPQTFQYLYYATSAAGNHAQSGTVQVAA